MPNKKSTKIVSPGISGAKSVTVPLELKPPPSGCNGPSNVTPWRVMGSGPPQPSGSLEVTDDLNLRSAMPGGAGYVVMSNTRKRSAVISFAVVFVNARRSDMVPNVELFAGSETCERTLFGGVAAPTHGATSEMNTEPFVMRGSVRPERPGAPSRSPLPDETPFATTSRKSAALSPVSLGEPPGRRSR